MFYLFVFDSKTRILLELENLWLHNKTCLLQIYKGLPEKRDFVVVLKGRTSEQRLKNSGVQNSLMQILSTYLSVRSKNKLAESLVKICNTNKKEGSEYQELFEKTRRLYEKFTSMSEIHHNLESLLKRAGFYGESCKKAMQQITQCQPPSLEEFLKLDLLKQGDAFYLAACEFLQAYLQEGKQGENSRAEYDRLKRIALKPNNYKFCSVFPFHEWITEADLAITAKTRMALVQTKFINARVDAEDGKGLRVFGRYVWNGNEFLAVAYTITPSTFPNQNQFLQ